MSKNNPESGNLHRAIKEVAPYEKADIIVNKYENLVSNLNDALVKPEKKKIIEDAKDHLDGIANKIIDLGNLEVSDENYVRNREELIEDFDSEMDNVAATLTAELEKSQFEDLKEKVMNFISELAKMPEGFAKETKVLRDSQKYITLLLSFENLSEDAQEIQDDLINKLTWKFAYYSTKSLNIPKFVSSVDFVNGVEKLKKEKNILDSREFMYELGEIVENLLGADLSKESSKLPNDIEFYNDLIDLINFKLQKSGNPELKEEANFIFSQLDIIKVKIERASYFKPGSTIWRSQKDEADTITQYRRADETFDSTNPQPSQKHNVMIGTIEEVDFYNARLRFLGEEKSYDLAEFEQYDVFVGNEDSPESKPMVGWMESGDYEYVDGKKIYLHGAGSLEGYFERKNSDALLTFLNEFGKNVKVTPAYIPERSYLKSFLEKNYLEINEKGNLKVVNGPHPLLYLEKIYEDLLEQIEIEEIYEAKNGLDPADPYFEARKLFLESEIDLKGKDAYTARLKLIEFLKKVETVKAPADPGIEHAKDCALNALKAHSAQRLDGMLQNAQLLFGEKEEYKDFLREVEEKLKEEKERISASNDYKIDYDKIRLHSWRNQEGVRTHHSLLEEKARAYRAKEMPYYRDSIGRDTGESVTNKDRELTPKELKARLDVANKAAAYEAEYLEEHHPGMYEIQSWNALVNFESNDAVGDYGSRTERRKKLEILGDKIRNEERNVGKFLGPSGDVTRMKEENLEIHPELAQAIYKEALSEDIADAEARFLYNREDRKKKILEKDGEKFLAQAKEQIKETLASVDFINQFLSYGNFNLDEYKKRVNFLTSDENLEILAREIVEAEVEEQIIDDVYSDFYTGKITQDVDATRLWEKIQSSKKDRGALERDKFLRNIIILAGSAAIGNFALAASRLAAVTYGSRAVATWVGEAGLSYRLASLGTEITYTTLADKSMHSLFLNENTWSKFGKDWLHNFGLFGVGKGVNAVWRGVAGQNLTKLATRAAEAGQLFRSYGYKTVNSGAELALETTVFTPLGVVEKLAFGEAQYKDIDWSEEIGTNLQTFLGLKAGNKIFGTVTAPLIKKIETKATRRIENMDSTHALFLKNNGLNSTFFKDHATPAEKLAAIESYRSYIDKYDIAPGIFEGKSLAEIKESLRAVDKIASREDAPSSGDLTDLALTNPAAFRIVASRMTKLPLNTSQIEQIAQRNAGLLHLVLGKLPKGTSDLLELIKAYGSLDRVKSTDSGLSSDLRKSLERIERLRLKESVKQAVQDSGLTMNRNTVEIKNSDAAPEKLMNLVSKLNEKGFVFERTSEGFVARKGKEKVVIKVERAVVERLEKQFTEAATELDQTIIEIEKIITQMEKAKPSLLLDLSVRLNFKLASAFTTMTSILLYSPGAKAGVFDDISKAFESAKNDVVNWVEPKAALVGDVATVGGYVVTGIFHAIDAGIALGLPAFGILMGKKAISHFAKIRANNKLKKNLPDRVETLSKTLADLEAPPGSRQEVEKIYEQVNTRGEELEAILDRTNDVSTELGELIASNQVAALPLSNSLGKIKTIFDTQIKPVLDRGTFGSREVKRLDKALRAIDREIAKEGHFKTLDAVKRKEIMRTLAGIGALVIGVMWWVVRWDDWPISGKKSSSTSAQTGTPEAITPLDEAPLTDEIPTPVLEPTNDIEHVEPKEDEVEIEKPSEKDIPAQQPKPDEYQEGIDIEHL